MLENMAGALYSVQELNTIITMLGCLCATVQAGTGIYASVIKKKTALIKTNDIINRAHRGFGGFATTLYLLGLFAGLSGFIGAFLDLEGAPPLEYNESTFTIHVWMSFPIMVVILWKTYISYFKKGSVFKYGRKLGIATFLAWAYTWITSAFSYYWRIEPPNLAKTTKPFPPPLFLLPIDLLWLQIIFPFILGLLIFYPIYKKAERLEKNKEKKRKEQLNNN